MGAEEEIKKHLQRLMVEFSFALKTNGVLQNFYSNIFVLNTVRFIASPVHERIDKDSAVKKRKHKDQINVACAIGDMKRRTVLLFLRSLEKIKSIIGSIKESFSVNTKAVRKERKFPRDKRKKWAGKKAFIQDKPI